MIRFDASDLISLPQAAHSLPGNVCPATVWRWSTKGRNGVKLSTVKVGHTRYTTKAALQRFLIDSDPMQADVRQPITIGAHDDADRFLEAEGL